jgi:peptide/nickel transport system substrate-binding protein
MRRRLMFSVAMLAVGVGLLVAAGFATPASSGTERKGGTFKYSLDTDIDYVDHALAYYTLSWEIEYVTCSQLLNYPDAAAPRGSRLVPDAATAMPTVSRDGKTYTFRVRTNRKFSDGSRLTANNFRFSLNRLLNKSMSSPAQPFFEDIVGAKAVIAGNASTASGIRVLSGNRLQIKLTKRAPDLLSRLAMPFACAMKTNTPINPDGISAPVIGSGPYYISAWTPKRSITVKRNRFYNGPRPHNLDTIDYDIGLPLATIRLNIEEGKTDHGPVPSAAHAELGRKYGVKKKSPGQYFVNPSAAFRYLAMNHERGLFGKVGGGANSTTGNVKLKQAVNNAIDRIAMINQRGAYAGVINDQYMPPTMQGFRNAAIYPARPNLTKAKSLAAGNTRGGNGVFYTCNTGPCIPIAQIVQANLRQIGLDMDIKPFPRAVQFTKTGTRGEPFDLTLEGWHMDYFDPYDFIFLLDGGQIRPANNVNFSYFNSSAYNRKIAKASALVGQARYRSFGNLDVDLAKNAAPLASFISDNTRLLFSSRSGCFFYHPVYEVDLAGICLK